ncbi:hypothetical protein Q8F55_004272 [Vanrija albida]|uniref:Ricin B lectin domain-containing protein n=1 Tax=Vanrija albida TaxID=181172 RepID=A0ABR3Q745_9TREE
MPSPKTALLALLAAASALAAPAPAEPRAGAPNILSQLITAGGKPLCLDARDGLVANGTAVQLWECFEGNRNQLWLTGQRDGVTYRPSILPGEEDVGLCLDAGEEPANGSRVHLWKCFNWLPQQRWEMVRTAWGPGSYLRLRDRDLCLDVTDGAFENGTPLQVWKCTEGPNQLFRRVSKEQGGRPYSPTVSPV